VTALTNPLRQGERGEMNKYSFGCPTECNTCASFSEVELRLVPPYFKEGGELKLMLVGQDPTVRREPARVKHALMLDEPKGQLRRWLTKELFGKRNFDALTLYATNLVKCSFQQPPSTTQQGGFRFLQPYFDNCRDLLAQEISAFGPALVLTLGEPAHKLFITILDNRDNIADRMKKAFTGRFVKAEFGDIEFDYSPCLHIQTFRVAETYGDRLKRFKRGLEAYFKASVDDFTV